MVQERIKSRTTLRNFQDMRGRRAKTAPGGVWRAEYTVLDADGRALGAAVTAELFEAHRWLATARRDGAAGALWIGCRRRPAAPWRRHGPVLTLPALVGGEGRLDPAELAATPLPVTPREARARARALLLRGGLGAPGAASLLQRYEGFFPSLEVGLVQILQARLGRRTWLAWVDLRAMLWDLIAGATLWTLPDSMPARAGERSVAGVHVFAA